ncbi:hypothetical protein QP028_14815 [Corynebacterium suedekumii]|nr:hypothetical protein QP028_14815 [Corynebacterium suedekumii]
MGARRGFLAAVTAVSMLALAACTGGQDGADGGPDDSAAPQSTDYFGYLVDTELVTSNAATDIGASSNTEALSGRLYPAVFVPGPSGQMIPNTDLVRTQVLPGANRQVIYTIAEDATYLRRRPRDVHRLPAPCQGGPAPGTVRLPPATDGEDPADRLSAGRQAVHRRLRRGRRRALAARLRPRHRPTQSRHRPAGGAEHHRHAPRPARR